MAQERVRTGIEGLDVLLNDGPVPKRSHVVAGPRGTRVVIPGPALGSWSADRLIRARTKRGSTAAAWRHEAMVLALIAVIVAASVASAFMSGNGPAASPPQDRPLASAWSEVFPLTEPPAGRYDHTAVYNPASNRMVVFGGKVSALTNSVWVLTNANGLGGAPAWTKLAPTGVPPSARTGHTAVYNATTDRMVVFGGQASPFRNDVWVLSEANGLPVPFVPRIVAIALTVVAMGLLALGTQGGPSHRLLPRRESKAVAAPATHDTAGHR